MAIASITVNGVTHHIDYNGLENLPTIPDLTDIIHDISDLSSRITSLENSSGSSASYDSELPMLSPNDSGKVLGVDSYGGWQLMYIDLSPVTQEIENIKQRLTALENSPNSSIQRTVSGQKLVISGAANVTGTKLNFNSASVNISGNKLTI